MKLKNLILLAVVITALLLAKFFFFPSQSGVPDQKGGGKPGGGGGAPANVTAVVLHPEKLSNEVYASGTIMANEEVKLQPELSGKIVQLNFQEGSKVSKGQLLVKINDADLQANYKKLQLQYKLAEEKLNRQKQLLAINGISQEEFDVLQNQYDVVKADMDYATAQIAKTEIRAPFDGMIGLKSVSEGAYVTPATVIAGIQQVNPLKIDFFVAEQYSAAVKKGAELHFTVEGNNEKLSGQVYAVEPKIDMSTRSLQVRAVCPNAKGTILPGAFARVQLQLGGVDSALMLPTEAVIPDLKGKKVFVIRNGQAEPQKVVTGLRTDEKIQVVEGLKAGDTVVARGIMQLKPGTPVKIKELK
jgi:membrane fusion protein (multidrug efflux system)